ncbi:MAG: hypothetical protein KUA35_16345 [Pseudodesulfovibrio sp.]|uniref:Uncharacterized protein n=1 Tax=Pseudodesulfovibrio aespoeensis (strain ATCC 700646 / DSM 10631 / Aspo-2) TaxID=643562 RepID=E6VW97_PSEA9|nr:hypothetical protein [Pseudodesulfovibrio sp.]ADU63657.1 hypothetical protein Daes_2661 [Pseudodesulfovibrio aespoeensis Aspo-2]MBV1773985.1 hypothetical protein [Pseudodesulfovibrio sp.]
MNGNTDFPMKEGKTPEGLTSLDALMAPSDIQSCAPACEPDSDAPC